MNSKTEQVVKQYNSKIILSRLFDITAYHLQYCLHLLNDRWKMRLVSTKNNIFVYLISWMYINNTEKE